VPKRPKRPRDPNQLDKLIVDIATGVAENTRPTAPMPATEARRKSELKGGKSRAKKLSARKRKVIAKKAALARWRKAPKPDSLLVL